MCKRRERLTLLAALCVGELERVRFVMKDGQVVRNDLASPLAD
jgi:hypothetical protein